jgi:gas vesicle structural protein
MIMTLQAGDKLIELLTIDARIVIASVDTYLRFAEAVNRLDLTETSDSLTDVISE